MSQASATAASKYVSIHNNGQKRPKYNNLDSLAKDQFNSLIYTVKMAVNMCKNQMFFWDDVS